jgi:hypothetical protein
LYFFSDVLFTLYSYHSNACPLSLYYPLIKKICCCGAGYELVHQQRTGLYRERSRVPKSGGSGEQVSRGCQPQGDTLPRLHPVPALLPPLLVYRYGLRGEDRGPEAVNPRGTPFLVYTQSRPSSLLSWSTGMIPEAVNPRGTPFLVYTQSQPSSLSSWSTGMDYSERTEVLRMSTPGDTVPRLHPVSSLLPHLLGYMYGLW